MSDNKNNQPALNMEDQPHNVTEWRLKAIEDRQETYKKDLDGKFKGLYDHIDKRTKPNYQLWIGIASVLVVVFMGASSWLYSSIVSESEFKEYQRKNESNFSSYQMQNMKEMNEIKVLILSEDMRKSEIKRIQQPTPE